MTDYVLAPSDEPGKPLIAVDGLQYKIVVSPLLFLAAGIAAGMTGGMAEPVEVTAEPA